MVLGAAFSNTDRRAALLTHGINRASEREAQQQRRSEQLHDAVVRDHQVDVTIEINLNRKDRILLQPAGGKEWNGELSPAENSGQLIPVYGLRDGEKETSVGHIQIAIIQRPISYILQHRTML